MDSVSFGRSMHPSEFVPCAQWGQHLGGLSGHSLKSSSAGVTSSAVLSVGDFVKQLVQLPPVASLSQESGYI